jgi:beta-aspartyl-peptidase (threonine type)
MQGLFTVAAGGLLLSVTSCADPATEKPTATRGERRGGRMAWAIAIHGGAGTIPRTMPAEVQQEYRDSLARALDLGARMLADGRPGLDVVEAVIRDLEDDPRFNAGRGAVFTNAGGHELDASIMDGRDLSCGAVAATRTVKNPISLARLVKDRTRHVLLAGDGAEAFAEAMGVERRPPEYFATERRREQWERARAKEAAGGGAEADAEGTVGAVVLDQAGNLAAGTSSGGLTNKRVGRVGDSALVGAGTYADDRTVAVSCTGSGEEFIRRQAAHALSVRVALLGETVQQAADHVIHDTLEPGDGGLIAVDSRGAIAFSYSTAGMYRGAADSRGRREVRIWEE